jgi:lipoprotein-anchoring transpeptidase ErfK/SrfK
MSAVRLLSWSLFVFVLAFGTVAALCAHPQTGAVARLSIRLMTAQEEREPTHHPLSPRVLDAAQSAELAEADFSAAASVTILPDLEPETVEPERTASAGTNTAASQEDGPSTAVVFPDPGPRNRAAFAALRLKAALDQDMWNNFDLFLYVSKAEHGPLAQRMYVFRNEGGEDFALLYDWAASTGREQQEVSPRGRRAFTATPRGYYQLDPQRMYPSYQSYNWDQPMPHAMFFNWERKGRLTGLAIHATSAQSLEKLGQRASAGCIHLSPVNAETLFKLIRTEYRGQVPRFAYNAKTRTMKNDGAFMRDRKGRLKMADGYKVLIFIEDYGGKNIVAALDDPSNPL